jgi:oxygen-independent coproporphyrinogen-3 oxidase
VTGPLSLYIHWPFCAAKCPYCDFNSHVRASIEEGAWEKALLTEMNYWAAQIGPRTLRTIFFGGGTPSLMPPKTVAALIANAKKLWPSEDEPEITLEANPTSSEAEKFRALREAGVNRLSLGVQALNDAELQFLGRKHDVKQALGAIEMARATFPRFSFDLIYARKNQTVAGWENELREALKIAGKHLSLYQLTLEPNTGFFARAQAGEVLQASNDDQAEMFELTQTIMEEAGLPLYEISNHAAPGEECRHNLAYWEYGEWVGIGPGAHGRVYASSSALRATGDAERLATIAIRTPETWLKTVQSRGNGVESAPPLSPRDAQEEAFLMNIRLRKGIDKQAWEKRFGSPLTQLIDAKNVQALINAGLMQESATHLQVRPEGLIKLNAITEKLLAA